MKKIVLITGAVLAVILLIVLIILINIYSNNLKPLSTEENIIRVEIIEGTGTYDIAKLLEEKKVIKNSLATFIYAKLNRVNALQPGKFDLDSSDDVKTILSHIANGDFASDEIKVTFIEGKNMRWMAKTIAENTVNTEQDVYDLLEDEEYLDSLIERYWFITDEIKDSRIYYPLEGYLLPDTYIFESPEVSVKTVFNVLLNFMEKYLDEFKDEIEDSTLTVHQILTLASLAEVEGKSTTDRAEIVGVFYNRLRTGMSLGSDVSTYYAFKIDMGERDLTVKEINTENPYNTRGPNMNGKIPVGPINNPSKSAIDAALHYTETDNFYFVADKNGKAYFTKNYSEHQSIINKLKKEGLWYTY